ncbi:hypothetical protein ACFQ8O_27725 [Streptomyces coelicoflavus]|uniref:hypothetical protein n=1 Tax=Streptomyces coelicoflavus TaxID=285562 RepID=UPI0036B8D3A5
MPVIAAAEDLVAATSGLDLNEKDGERFVRHEAVAAGAPVQGTALPAAAGRPLTASGGS